MARRKKTLAEQYSPYVVKFFRWFDNSAYAAGHQFSNEDFARVTPEVIVRYMKLLSYGTETPGPNDHPTLKRSSGLGQLKKALSYFMPDNSVAWNTAAASGNPTMSKAVNKFIAEVKKAEVRKQGKPSQAKRDLSRAEFKKTLAMLQAATSDFSKQYKVPAMLKLQFHLIARTDDISNLESAGLREHEKFGAFALQTQVAWSKNVREERDCPPQIILGANDPDFCCLISLAGYLESRFGAQWGNARFLFGERNDDDEPFRTNSNYSNALKSQWDKPEFKTLMAQIRGGVGTHSIRKFASTWSAEHGCTHQDVETRGRWKGGKSGRTVNLYINLKQLPTDGKVAAVLCVGQPVKYKLKPDSGITTEWLLTHVVPGIHDHYDADQNNRIADVLALPLLYACLEPGLEHLMAPAVRSRVVTAWEALRGDGHPAEWNPVNKVVLKVYRYENELVIDELLALENGAGAGAGGDLMVANQVAGNQQQLGVIVNQLHQVKQQQSEDRQAIQMDISAHRAYCQHQFTHLHRTMGKLIMQPTRQRVIGGRPAARTVAVTAGAAGRGPIAGRGNAGGRGVSLAGYRRLQENAPGLSRCPRNLHDLWREWTDGLFNNKPASQLAVSERGGKIRHVYFKRKAIWDIIKRFTDKGIHHTTAISTIEQAYGPGKSVSHYIKCVLRDKKNGGHPSLNVV
jgi:hypothetical protein